MTFNRKKYLNIFNEFYAELKIRKKFIEYFIVVSLSIAICVMLVTMFFEQGVFLGLYVLRISGEILCLLLVKLVIIRVVVQQSLLPIRYCNFFFSCLLLIVLCDWFELIVDCIASFVIADERNTIRKLVIYVIFFVVFCILYVIVVRKIFKFLHMYIIGSFLVYLWLLFLHGSILLYYYKIIQMVLLYGVPVDIYFCCLFLCLFFIWLNWVSIKSLLYKIDLSFLISFLLHSIIFSYIALFKGINGDSFMMWSYHLLRMLNSIILLGISLYGLSRVKLVLQSKIREFYYSYLLNLNLNYSEVYLVIVILCLTIIWYLLKFIIYLCKIVFFF